jgi:hypothetical protein
MTLTTEQIDEELKLQGYVASLWHIEDVKEVRPDVTDAQAMQVLEHCINKHDAEIGINWLVLETVADLLFPKADEDEE